MQESQKGLYTTSGKHILYKIDDEESGFFLFTERKLMIKYITKYICNMTEVLRGNASNFLMYDFFDTIYLCCEKNIKDIIEIQINDLKNLLLQKKIVLNVDNKAREWLQTEGFVPEYGARPLKRIIQKNIKNKIAEKILSNELKDKDKITVSADEEKILIFT